MPDIETYKEFKTQYEQRFDEFQQWAIQNWPDKETAPSSWNFGRCRVEAEALLAPLLRSKGGAGSAQPAAKEPAEGGEQYVSVTPAPWP